MSEQTAEKAPLRCRLFGHRARLDVTSWGVWHGRRYCARCLRPLPRSIDRRDYWDRMAERLVALHARGVPPRFLSEIVNAGPRWIETMGDLTDEQLAEAVTLWREQHG